MKDTENTVKNPLISSVKCYKSAPCIISVLVVLLILGGILYDFIYVKPKMQKDLSGINSKIVNIDKHIERIDAQQKNVYNDFVQALQNNYNKKK